MAIITAVVVAAAAVGTAAAGAATVAAVAALVVAASVAIGTIGLAVSVVGMVTGNKTIMKVGKIMGYVGLAGGIAGGLIGGIGAMSNAAGGSMTDAFIAGAKGAYTDAAAFGKEAYAKSPVTSWMNESGGTATLAGKGAPVTTPGAAPGVPPGTQTGGALSASSNASPNTLVTPLNSGGLSPTPPPSALAPNVPGNNLLDIRNSYTGPYGSQYQPQLFPTAPTVTTPTASAPGMFASVPDYIKYGGLTTAGQGVSGLASGYFAGSAKEAEVEQARLQNEQAQAQIQYYNANNSYAPVVGQTPLTGMLQNGRPA